MTLASRLSYIFRCITCREMTYSHSPHIKLCGICMRKRLKEMLNGD
jgi:hypothetical protein